MKYTVLSTIAIIVLAQFAMAQTNGVPDIRRVRQPSRGGFPRVDVERLKEMREGWAKFCQEEDKARGEAENVVVARAGVFGTAPDWKPDNGKGLLLIVVNSQSAPGYELKFDSEGRLAGYAPYTNHLAWSRQFLPPHRSAAGTVPPPRVPSSNYAHPAGAASAETADAHATLPVTAADSPTAKPGKDMVAPELKAPQIAQEGTGKASDADNAPSVSSGGNGDVGAVAPNEAGGNAGELSTNNYFMAWGVPIGAEMIQVREDDNTLWKIPGHPRNISFRLPSIESFSMPPVPSIPIVNLTCRRFRTNGNLFDASWFVYEYVSVDNQIVAVSTMTYSEGVEGTAEEIEKSPLAIRCQKILATLKELYGENPEIAQTSHDRHIQYTWHKDSVDIILTTGLPSSLTGTLRMNGVITLYYIDKDLVAKANEAYKQMPQKRNDDGEQKERAKDLL